MAEYITIESIEDNFGGYDALVQYKCYVFVAKLNYHGRYGVIFLFSTLHLSFASLVIKEINSETHS